MKKTFFFLGVMLTYFSTQAQNIITVNNNPGASADFSSLQAAIDDVNTRSGDTIYVSGSAVIYDNEASLGDIRVNKRLIIVGPGHSLSANPKTQNNKLSAIINGMVIGEGADGSVIMGLSFSSSFANIEIISERRDGNRGTNNVQGILLTRNFLNERVDIDGTAQDITLSQNFIREYIYLDEGAANVFITNNLMFNSGVIGDDVTYSNIEIRNNTFYGIFERRIGDIRSIKIENNILINTVLFDCDNSDVFNNVFVSPEDIAINSFSTGNNLSNNKFGVVQADLFTTTDPTLDDLVYDNELILGPNSEAISAGRNGEDAGAFGGNAPYILSGLPPIPSIYDLNTSGVGSSQTGLNVTIKVKSNQ